MKKSFFGLSLLFVFLFSLVFSLFESVNATEPGPQKCGWRYDPNPQGNPGMDYKCGVQNENSCDCGSISVTKPWNYND